ncbi:uncharacterized protein LOC123310396 [Coccinella septempunctata]|uniref:uncharacterized protein LOC123310396 n=1 Tax=Coccinella septempunctata TaxID=41139 RepID=UPI001D08CBA0|nr:uncharacterized protein LOC123310396 [Coccinella septempunctata]
MLIYKRKDHTKIENYRAIRLLSHLYKLFTRTINNRLTKRLDSYQPIEQAGFRKGLNSNDHLQTIEKVIEKPREYNIPLHRWVIDYQKAFDSIETGSFLTAMEEKKIDSRYSARIFTIGLHSTLK